MQYIILAAGKGSRTGLNKPKVMIEYKKKTLLQHHLECARLYNLDPIVVTGYKSEEITGVESIFNKNYNTTNMVESLMICYDKAYEDAIISYGDIIFNPIILKNLIKENEDFVITVDKNWTEYWKLRFIDIHEDTESLSISNGYIKELGTPNPDIANIDARYVGLMKFSKKALKILNEIYLSDVKWKNAYMTDILQEAINQGHKIKANNINNMWLEFDNMDDIKNAEKYGRILNV